MDSGGTGARLCRDPGGARQYERRSSTLIEAFTATNAYAGTPDFLKILLDVRRRKGRDVSSIPEAGVSGAGLPEIAAGRLRRARGSWRNQAYTTADVGFIAYETGHA